KKFGFFMSEKEKFEKIAGVRELERSSPQSWTRHPLAFLVEAADDICYSIIDLEDGCSLGLVSEEEARTLFEQVIKRGRSKLDKLHHLKGKQERIGHLRALAIGDLIEECATMFLDHEQEMLDGKFDKALADNCPSSQALKSIIDVSVRKIYRAPKVVEIEASGHEVLPGLLREFIQASFYFSRSEKSRKYQNLALLLPEETRSAIRESAHSEYDI